MGWIKSKRGETISARGSQTANWPAWLSKSIWSETGARHLQSIMLFYAQDYPPVAAIFWLSCSCPRVERAGAIPQLAPGRGRRKSDETVPVKSIFRVLYRAYVTKSMAEKRQCRHCGGVWHGGARRSRKSKQLNF